MYVLEEMKYHSELTTDTRHLETRHERIRKYKHLLSSKFISCFVVDKQHKNGLEVHCINDKGLIYIYNKESKKLITILHPRPKQIKRYYQQLSAKIPKQVKALIDKNYKRNLHNKFNEL